jgi:hypothetical protein
MCIQGFWWENLREMSLKNLGVVRKIILKWILKSEMELMDSIYLGYDRNRQTAK